MACVCRAGGGSAPGQTANWSSHSDLTTSAKHAKYPHPRFRTPVQLPVGGRQPVAGSQQVDFKVPRTKNATVWYGAVSLQICLGLGNDPTFACTRAPLPTNTPFAAVSDAAF